MFAGNERKLGPLRLGDKFLGWKLSTSVVQWRRLLLLICEQKVSRLQVRAHTASHLTACFPFFAKLCGRDGYVNLQHVLRMIVLMRAKTVKRWLIFITVLSLIAGIGFFIQRFQVARLAKLVVERADKALNEGDFANAEKLYWEHLVLFPADIVVKLKYADVILKVAPLPKRQAEALQIYNEVLTQNPGRADVRRKQALLKFAMGRLTGAGRRLDDPSQDAQKRDRR